MRGLVLGCVADELGLTVQLDLVQVGRLPELVRRHAAWPSTQYRAVQATNIPLDVDHGKVIGRVLHLEQRAGSGLWAVAEVDDVAELPDQSGLYFSPSVRGTLDDHATARDIELDGLALTRKPATNAAQQVQVLAGELRDVARRPRQQLLGHSELLQRAAENRTGTSRIVDLRPGGQQVERSTSRSVGHGKGRTVGSGKSTSRLVELPDGRLGEMHHTAPWFGGVLTVSR